MSSHSQDEEYKKGRTRRTGGTFAKLLLLPSLWEKVSVLTQSPINKKGNCRSLTSWEAMVKINKCWHRQRRVDVLASTRDIQGPDYGPNDCVFNLPTLEMAFSSPLHLGSEQGQRDCFSKGKILDGAQCTGTEKQQQPPEGC